MDFSGIEKLDLENWDGKIVCTLFMAGCDLRCPFCHNASLVINHDQAPKIPWEDIIGYLRKRAVVIDAVCITGGEPTLMPDLADKLSEIKEIGYLVKLDTNGTRPEVVRLLHEQGLIDYVAMDIKNSENKYAATSGLKSMKLDDIKETISYLINSGIDHEFRTTTIEEFHSTMDFEDIGHLIKGARRFFIQKYVDREGCIERGFHPVEKQKALIYKAIMEKYVKRVELRGYD